MMKRAQHAAPLQGKTRDNVFVVASMFDRRGAACELNPKCWTNI
ncbi:Uncharacterised protein [Serratia fonticola]|nr:Uncharacterised protein [Serratia fonticola]